MDAIMTSGPISGLAEPDPTFHTPKIIVGVKKQVRAVLVTMHRATIRFFDWIWELRQDAYERNLVERMSSRERRDIGLSPRVRGEDSSIGFWRD